MRFSSVRVNICQIPHVSFELVNSFSIFASFFIVITHNCEFEAHTFSTWDKSTPQNIQFWVPTLSALFSKPQLSFLQILHHSLASWKITPMYFFRSSITYISHFSRDQSKCKLLKLLSTLIKIHQILVTFKTTNQFYFKFCINLQCQETQLLCTFIAEILYTFNKRNLSRYKFG